MAVTTGVGVGLVYFYGLWLTVRHVVGSSRTKGWIVGSHALRLSLVTLVFYGVSLQGWHFLPAALIGFGLARWHLVRYFAGGSHGSR